MVSLMDMGSTNGSVVELTRASLRQVRCTARVNFRERMGEPTMVVLNMVSHTDLECFVR